MCLSYNVSSHLEFDQYLTKYGLNLHACFEINIFFHHNCNIILTFNNGLRFAHGLFQWAIKNVVYSECVWTYNNYFRTRQRSIHTSEHPGINNHQCNVTSDRCTSLWVRWPSTISSLGDKFELMSLRDVAISIYVPIHSMINWRVFYGYGIYSKK